MRITQEVDYAFRICSYLASKKGEVVAATEISETQAIPERFTLRILRKLNLAGITDAKRGAYGGYYLVRDKYDLNLYEIIEAIDGPIQINRCLRSGDAYCSKNNTQKEREMCKFHQKLSYIQNSIIDMFKQTSLAEFAKTSH